MSSSKEKRPNSQWRTKAPLVNSFYTAITTVVLISTGSRGQIVGVDICACSPRQYEMELNLNNICDPVLVELGTGVSETSCYVAGFSDPEVTDLTPVVVSSVQFIEIGQDGNPISLEQEFGNFRSGSTFTFTSVSANTDNVPRSLQTRALARNQNGETLIMLWALTYSNDCGTQPVLNEGESVGWIIFADLKSPRESMCPLAALLPSEDPSDAPSHHPTTTPSNRPSTSPSVIPSISPSMTHIPSIFPSEKPTRIASHNPSSHPTSAHPTSILTSAQPSQHLSITSSFAPSIIPSLVMPEMLKTESLSQPPVMEFVSGIPSLSVSHVPTLSYAFFTDPPSTPLLTHIQTNPPTESPTQEHKQGEYSYEFGDLFGPDNWANVSIENNQCDGNKQSPISITDFDCSFRLNYEFNSGNCLMKAGSAQLNKDSLQYNFETCDNPTFKMPNHSNIFEAIQIRIHASSGHTINGEYFGAELHILHTQQGGGQVAFVAIMVEGGADEDNKTFERLLALWHAQDTCAKRPIPPHNATAHNMEVFDPYVLVPIGSSFYQYKGSLTTPPCSETVLWNVADKAVVVSDNQLSQMISIITNLKDPNNGCKNISIANSYGSTSRPPQSLKNRSVQKICPSATLQPMDSGEDEIMLSSSFDENDPLLASDSDDDKKSSKQYLRSIPLNN